MSDPVPSKRVRGDAVLGDPLILELLNARLVGVFATLNRDGTIHAVPMWFAPHERSILFATGSRSEKVANLEVDSRSTLVIHDSRPGYEVCGVSMAGHAEIVRDVDAQPLVRHVHRRYIDESRDMPQAVRAFLDSDDVALRFRPQSAFTWDQRETEANIALRVAAGALPLLTTDARSAANPNG
jgi:PPOX class probable F420-dependent enzyme